jgi:GT2 family glycosyltransferase
VIPAYERAALLPRALASVAAQTRPPAELIVVDDGSADDSAAVAERLGARVIRHERNRGVSAARNTALEAARGEWIAFLDTDDEWPPRHLEGLWASRDGHAAAAHTAVWVERPGREHHAYGLTGRHPRVLHDPAPIVADNFIPLSASLVRRAAAERAGGFDTALTRAEDLDFWIRLLEQGSVLLLPEIGAIYHVHPDQATTDAAAPWRATAGRSAATATAPGGPEARCPRWRCAPPGTGYAAAGRAAARNAAAAPGRDARGATSVVAPRAGCSRVPVACCCSAPCSRAVSRSGAPAPASTSAAARWWP